MLLLLSKGVEGLMLSEKMAERTLKIIRESERFSNPWKKYDLRSYLNQYFLESDLNIIGVDDRNSLRKKIIWTSKDESEYPFDLQFPVPINGNFWKAKYLLLYSNPGSETMVIPEPSKKKLLKCYHLDFDAELVIPNKQWFNWYIGELDKFYIDTHDQEKEFDWDSFSSNFCFINFFAYPSGKIDLILMLKN